MTEATCFCYCTVVVFSSWRTIFFSLIQDFKVYYNKVKSVNKSPQKRLKKINSTM